MRSIRRKIIETTAILIRSKGYENTRLSDILEATGTGKGQFYYYFSSKKELGLAVIDYSFESFERNLLQGVLGSDKDPEIKFDEMLRWIVSFHRSMDARCGCVFGNLALEMSEHDEAFRGKLAEIFSIWADTLHRIFIILFKPCGTAETEEVNKLALSVVGMIEGGILMMKSKQDITVLQDMTDWIRYLVDAYALKRAAGRNIKSAYKYNE